MGEVPIHYAYREDYLDHEFAALDARIQREILRIRQRATSGGFERFQGLAISEAEVWNLLLNVGVGDGAQAPPGGDTSDDSLWIERFARAEAALQELRSTALVTGLRLPLAELATRFGLSRLQERILVVALAAEADRRYEKIFAYLQDDVTRRKPTVDLVVTLVGGTREEKRLVQCELSAVAPLIRNRIILLNDGGNDGPSSRLSSLIELDERIARFLLGEESADKRLEQVAGNDGDGAFDLTELVPIELQEFAQQLANASREAERLAIPPCFLFGPPGSATLETARWLAQRLGSALLQVNLRKVIQSGFPFDEMLWRVQREATLRGLAICFEGFDCLLQQEERFRFYRSELGKTACSLHSPVFLLSAREWRLGPDERPATMVVWRLKMPDEHTRRKLWEGHLNGELSEELRRGLANLANSHRLTPGQIRSAVLSARLTAWQRAPQAPSLSQEDLYQACSAHTNQQLGILARRVESCRGWKDIVLPTDSLRALHEINAHVKYRHVVYSEWGFGDRIVRSKGLSVLFYGASGTGKTLAAEILANDLHLELYKIDLSMVVSKYIGETEKNLEQIFQEAESANAILLFDEADALFGKRSEVKDAHDRYANIEIGYLLQRMEDYEGISIMTTNLRKNLDDAFVRRLQFIIEFPFPDELHRLRIWRNHMPSQAPLKSDVDLEFLARQFKVSGGHIRNVVINAAFLAANEGGPLAMKHFIRASQREFQKIGKTCSEREFGDFYAFLKEPDEPAAYLLHEPSPHDQRS